MKKFIIQFSFLILSLVACGGVGLGQTSEFSYQGRLTEAGSPVTGTRFFRFTLFDENGAAIPGAVSEQTLTVSSGIFSAALDFSAAAFASGANRILQIEVKINAGDAYTLLNPRQPILSAPYSIKSKSADDSIRLGGLAASEYVTNSSIGNSFIRNSTTQQTGNFNISGNGFVGGNLGIGTTFPLSKLTVQTPTNNYGFLQTDGAITFGSFVGGTSAPVGGWFGTTTNHPLHFFTNNGAARMSIFTNGKIGFGTALPEASLHVKRSADAAVNYAIYGDNSDGFIGVFGNGDVGVYGRTTGSGAGSFGVWGDNNGSNTAGYAGYFQGRVQINGNLSKFGGSFKIDHPLDPANKYLYHSFVESPDMMNIYNGNTTTDQRGEAVITMPNYFDALNRDFRYQLTVIGQFAQAIVAEEIKNNRFKIRTDKPNVKVSWMVTGIRQDAYANENRIPVEEDKPATERGLYLYPKGFNQPAEKSVVKPRDLPRAR